MVDNSEEREQIMLRGGSREHFAHQGLFLAPASFTSSRRSTLPAKLRGRDFTKTTLWGDFQPWTCRQRCMIRASLQGARKTTKATI
jgi:hypothetical protein